MKIADWLSRSTTQLKSAGIDTARLDCLVLMCDALGTDKYYVLAHPEQIIESTSQKLLDKQIIQRSKHLPLAYIRGKSEFYGREFKVSESVLVPRPESETIIEILKKYFKNETIIDLGTGSGALAITAKLELPKSEVLAIDISESCLEIASSNARNLSAEISMLQSDLLSSIPSVKISKSIILANLPYVPDSHTLNQAAMNEPKLAIFGGPDGLDIYRQLFRQLNSQLDAGQPKLIICESLPFQHEQLVSLADSFGYQLIDSQDFITVFSPVARPLEQP